MYPKRTLRVGGTKRAQGPEPDGSRHVVKGAENGPYSARLQLLMVIENRKRGFLLPGAFLSAPFRSLSFPLHSLLLAFPNETGNRQSYVLGTSFYIIFNEVIPAVRLSKWLP